MKHLAETARRMLADHKGLLAMDESNGTCDKRFAKAGIPQTEEVRRRYRERRYRELIITTPDLAECVSGVILYDETIRQKRRTGRSSSLRHHPRHQGRYRCEGSCRPSGGKGHRGT